MASDTLELGRHLDRKRRQLLNVEIFSAGTFVPSTGPTREWTVEDIDDLIDAFNQGHPEVVHVKLGHTSPEFAKMVADQLDVPLEIVRGEDPEGDGQISLGQVTTLRRRQTKMVADMEVPEPVADIISKGFSTVSVEMLADFEGHDWVVSAVALLGAERPAVKDLAPFAGDATLVERKPEMVAVFKIKDNHILMADDDDSELSQWWDGVKANLAKIAGIGTRKTEHQESDMEVTTLAKSLHLQEEASPEEVTIMIDAIVEAMGSLKEALGLGPEATPEEVEEAAKEQFKEAATFKESKKGDKSEIVKLTEQVTALTRTNRIAHYKEQVSKFTAIEGTPEALAERLVATEAAQGEGAATALLGDWQASQKFADGAGLLKRIGSSREAEPTTFMAEVSKYKEAHTDASERDAQAAVRTEHPELWEANRDASVAGNGR